MTQFVLPAIFLLGLTSLCSAEPAVVGKQTHAWRAQHEKEILAEFAELLAIPNIAGDRPNIERNVKAVRALLEKHGIAVQVLAIEGASPIVVGDVRVPESHRTIAFYAHYDGQPVDAARWTSDPWKPDGCARKRRWSGVTLERAHPPPRLVTLL